MTPYPVVGGIVGPRNDDLAVRNGQYYFRANAFLARDNICFPGFVSVSSQCSKDLLVLDVPSCKTILCIMYNVHRIVVRCRLR